MDVVTWPDPGFTALQTRARRLLSTSTRRILGIAGAPGSGKSTLATRLYAELEAEEPGSVALVGMDAFHLAQRVLDRRGLAHVKGAPETFDVEGYLDMLRRLRSASHTVYAPEFRREIEDSIAGNVEVSPQVRLVVTEGNYLLLPHPPWSQVRPLLDEAWFLSLDDAVRRGRLTARHQLYGHDSASASAKALGSDDANARLVTAAQNDPDVWICEDAQ